MAERGKRKTRTGIVASSSMDKSIVVKVTRQIMHPTYGRTVRRSRKFMAHDAENQCTVGDTVTIVETRPISKNKRWRLEKVLEKAK